MLCPTAAGCKIAKEAIRTTSAVASIERVKGVNWGIKCYYQINGLQPGLIFIINATRTVNVTRTGKWLSFPADHRGTFSSQTGRKKQFHALGRGKRFKSGRWLIATSSRMMKNSKTPLPLGHPSGVLRVDVLQCTATPTGVFDRMFPGCMTSCRLRMYCWPFGHLRVCCWRAAQNRFSVLTAAGQLIPFSASC